MTINAYCSPTVERRKEHGHEGCPGTVYKYKRRSLLHIADPENRELVLCSCTCHAKTGWIKKETQ